MFRKRSDSEMKPLTWLIISGFVVASLSVVVMAYMAYNNLLSLEREVRTGTAPNRFLKDMDEAKGELNEFALQVRYYVISGEPDQKNKEFLENRKAINFKQYEALEKLGRSLDLPDSVKSKISDLIKLFEDRYVLLDSLWGLMDLETVALLSKDRKKANIDSIYIQYVLAEASGHPEQKPDVSTDFLSDENNKAVLFGTLQDFAKAELERKKQIQEVMDGERNLVQNIAALESYLKEVVRKKSKIGLKSVEEEADRARIFIGVATVMIIPLVFLFLARIISDVEKNRKLEARLKEEKQRAEELASAKEEFLAKMSHEMRTPMSAIIGFSNKMLQKPLDAEMKSFMGPIRHSADLLLQLINDVLDYSKLEANKTYLGKEPFHLRGLVEDVYELFIPQVEKKGIALSAKMGKSLPEVVWGDPLRLKQMLLNLVGNAVKFTDRGSVTISLKVFEQKGKVVSVLFQIIDTGIGIPLDQQKKIFEDFIQVDDSNSRKYGGTGLGLSITKKLADLHGGSLNLSSLPGKGTTVSLLIPYEIGDKKDIRIESDTSVEVHPELAGKRILLADDDYYNRLLVKNQLQLWNMHVDEVENGKEVIQKLSANQHYVALLMDLHMPELNGIKTTEYIRQELRMDLPIIALTATTSKIAQQEAIEAGMQAFLLKPFQTEDLHKELIRLLGLHHTKQVAENTQKETESMPSQPNPESEFPFPELYKVSRGDMGMIKRMLEQYVSLTDSNWQKLTTAAQAGNNEEVALLAHRMVPAHRHLGFQDMVNKLKRLEELADQGILDGEASQLIQEIPQGLANSKAKVKKVLAES
ncbi:MAG: ATP-binding protein [Bacteroidota bacterium]